MPNLDPWLNQQIEYALIRINTVTKEYFLESHSPLNTKPIVNVDRRLWPHVDICSQCRLTKLISV